MKSAPHSKGRGWLKVAVAVVAIAACDSADMTGPVPGVPASVAIAPDSAHLTYLGETLRFTAVVRDGTGASVGGAVRWASSDGSVVTVDGTGLVTARGNGRAEVRASLGDLGAAATVRVEQGASALQIFGDGQVALPGRPLPLSVGVQVQDAGGRRVAGALVRFRVTGGGGSVDPDSVRSDASGVSSTVWTVGPAVGEQRLMASVAGGAEAEFTARAVAPDSVVTGVALHSGEGATLNVGGTTGVKVRAVDGAGRPVPGALVRFAPESGGSVEPDSVRSDSSGLASAQWTLGLAPGAHTLAVTAGSGRLAVTATARDPAVAVATVELESRLVERAWAGQRIPLEVRLRRDTGIGLGGGLVTFLPGPLGGSATPDSTVSDPYGLATSVWTLGSTPGVYTMVVASGSVRLELSSRVLDPDSEVSRVVPRSGDGQWGLVSRRLQEPMVVQVLEESLGPVPGALVSFAPEAGSGSVEPDSVRTDSAGLASALWTLGPGPGAQRLTVAAGGLTRLELTAVAQPDAGVCGRTRAVIEELLRLTGVAHCRDVTAGHLASVERMKPEPR